MGSPDVVPDRKVAIQGHGVSTSSANYELMTTPVSICSVIAIQVAGKVALLHADSSISRDDIEEVVEQLSDTSNRGSVKPKLSYVCSNKAGYLATWTEIMYGQLPEFCYPKRSCIKFSAGEFKICDVTEAKEEFFHLPRWDMDALVDTECLWASLYFTNVIRFGPILLDSPKDLETALMAAGNALSTVHLLSFDGFIKEIQVDAFLRRYWKTTILGKFLEEFAPLLVPTLKDFCNLSVAETLDSDLVGDEDRIKVEEAVIDYGILVLSYLDCLKDFSYPTTVKHKPGDADDETTFVLSAEGLQSKKTNKTSPIATKGSDKSDRVDGTTFEDTFGNVTLSTAGSTAHSRARRASAIKLFEKKR
ncbi:uncharacterized protein [Diadema antillarum]|uniref:uncharacterized protein n=1 Tax=Diadema antillarum TaxID=105358 RepID=UPI003A8BA423